MSENIDHPTLKAIIKWKNYPRILELVSEHRTWLNFFYFISKEDILKEIKILDNSKAVQESDIPVKTIFTQLMNNYFNAHE